MVNKVNIMINLWLVYYNTKNNILFIGVTLSVEYPTYQNKMPQNSIGLLRLLATTDTFLYN